MKDERTSEGGRVLTTRGKVCTALLAATGEEMAAKATAAFALGSDLVEFRVDLAKEPPSRLAAEIARFARKAIITVRRKEEGGGFKGSEAERLEAISSLSRLKPAYLDIELTTARENPDWFRHEVSRGPRKIVSWHDFSGTPPLRALQSVRNEASALGDIAKVVTLAKGKRDNLRVLRLYEDAPAPLIAFCMGEAGRASRLAALRLGSPVTYAALPNELVAPGQISLITTLRLKKAWEKGVLV